MSKIDKLNELNDLLKSSIITEQEFTKLKNEILSFNQEVKNANQKRVYFNSFLNNVGKHIEKPQIEFLDVDNINNSDLLILKKFLAEKQKDAPHLMTQDEINVANKIFTADDIYTINSNRIGFNFPLLSIGGIVAGLFLFYLVTLDVCMMYLGGTSILLFSIIAVFIIFTNASSTKHDKYAAAICIIICLAALIYWGIAWQESFK